MEFRVLGPVEAWSEGVRLDLGSRKQRLVLAVMLLEANRPVSMDRLIDLTWTHDPPASSRKSIQALVSRLRSAFLVAGAGRPEILNQGAGYLLRVDPLTVDVHRFVDLTTRARGADDERAVELLDQALELWRGNALADVASDEVRDRLCGGLWEARWAALEDRMDARLRLGEARQQLGELTELVAEQPMRQRLVGQLILVLYRTGRTNDALSTYHRLRARLSDELGLDPAPELRELETAILRADPSLDVRQEDVSPPRLMRPAELPHDPRGFVGRDHELARLDAGVTAPSASTGIWVISGTAGVGKTALAVHWAHRSRSHFPDGQLYLDLRGFDAEHEPLTSSAALTQLLRGLGADPRLVPPEPDGQAKLFRSLLADKKILLVLDNARDAHQLYPLIPPTGTVLITSRQRLGEVIARTGAQPLPLDVLPTADSLRLLEVLLGAAQVAAEPVAATELVRRCGRLPLALRIAAANIAAGPEPEIAALTHELAHGDTLAELAVDGAEESAVTMALALSYRALSTEHRRMFRHLGLMPGQTFTAESAGAVAGLPIAGTNRLLRTLAAAHLVEQHTRGRFHFHDLLRRYAIDRVRAEDPPPDREQARERLLDHYLRTADAAGRRLIPHFLRLPRELPDGVRFTDTDAALAWLDAEWPNLTAAVSQAAKQGPHHFSWHLADALRAYFHHRGHRAEWVNVASTALAAARLAEDDRAQAAMHQSIALACVNSGRYEEARDHLGHAMRGNLASGWLEGQAAVLNNLSAVHQRLGDPTEAIASGLRSLTLQRELGSSDGVVMALANLGFAYWQLGALEKAREHFSRALELGEQAGARYSVAVLLVDLGNVHRDLGEDQVAEEFYGRALEANRDLGYRYGEATALAGRALLRCETSLPEPARPDAGTGLLEEMRSDADTAVELTGQLGDDGTQAWALNALGRVCLRMGQPVAAEVQHRRALYVAKRTSFYWCQADARTGLAETLPHLGRLDEARQQGEQALELARRAGYRLIESRVLSALAEVHLRLGDETLAGELSHRARSLALETGYGLGHTGAARLPGAGTGAPGEDPQQPSEPR
ncbi:BTAD domain-containing putative transcriptional regulator [Micromonospora sp. NPDC047548]|uniref:AfsR/SARP family transcriptional regulator n=1 Tax=Micromonospora sp. NPDC047548 TaxID=3155624 RepID=UPI0033C19165